MDLIRDKPIEINDLEDLEIYAIDWVECDETISVPDTDDDDVFIHYLKRKHNKEYVIFAFGCTKEGHSVCIKIEKYNPYFYIKIPEDWSSKNISEFNRNFIEPELLDINIDYTNDNKVESSDTLDDILSDNEEWYPRYPAQKIGCPIYKSSLLKKPELVEKEIFWTFTNHQKYKFWKFNFASKIGYKLYHSYMKNTQRYPIQYNKSDDKKGLKVQFKLFESELEPLLRFYHDRSIEPSNWIKIPTGKYKVIPNNSAFSTCQINVVCNWNDVHKCNKVGIPPLIVASFDIEADSSHGDFPIAKKDTKKLANELVISYLRERYILLKDVGKVNDDELQSKQKKAKENLEQKWRFFSSRIKQSIRHYLLENEDDVDIVDNDISPIYFKYNDREHKLVCNRVFNEEFKKMCKQMYYICNRPIRKIKANREMKELVNKVHSIYKGLEETAIKKKKPLPPLDTLLEIITSVAKTYNSSSKNKKVKKIDVNNLQDKILTKDIFVKFVNNLLKDHFAVVEGYRIIQIGTTFYRFGDEQPIHHNIITLGSCDKLEGIEVIDFPNSIKKKGGEYKEADVNKELNKNELKVLMEWAETIRKYDPDIILGYNIFGFDEIFMYDRLVELLGKYNITKKNEYWNFVNIGRLKSDTLWQIPECKGRLVEKKLASSALGSNYLYYLNMPGRVQIDLLKVLQADVTRKMPSYKLDSVAETLIGGSVERVGRYKDKKESKWLKFEYADQISVGNFVIISLSTGEQFLGGKKVQIMEKEKIEDPTKEDIKKSCAIVKLDEIVSINIMKYHPTWGLAKDDVSPKDIFRLQKEDSKGRAVIAKYCIQDCALVVRLLIKLKVIMNNFAMSNVCLVPFYYIFMRGQSIKIFSLIVNECSKENYLIPVLDKVRKTEDDDEEEKEVNPSKSNNLRYQTLDDVDEKIDKMEFNENFNVISLTDDGYEGAIVLTPQPGIYINDPITVLDFASLYPSEMIASNLSHDSHCENEYWLGDEGGKRIRELGYDFIDVDYDILTWRDPNNPNKGKHKVGVQVERFVQYSDGKKGLIPRILMKLLAARKATKKEMKTANDPFTYAVLDGKQLALKVTCNSVYGQTGASISKIYKKAIAASTTAGGRNCIYRAKDYVEKNNPGCEVVYGDSIPGDEFILVRANNNICYNKVEVIASEYFNGEDRIGKHYLQPNEFVETFTDEGWCPIEVMMRHRTRKHIYKIETTSGIVRVTEDHSLLLADGNIIKPTDVREGDTLLTCDIPNRLLCIVGLDRLREKYQVLLDGVVVKITDVGFIDCYVYDMTTHNGHFHAGIGNLVVHNTDSVFVKFNLEYEDGTYPKEHKEKIQRSIDIGLALQQKLKDDKYYDPPHDLEYEKVFCPLMLITKKRYGGEKYEFDVNKSKFTSMGIVLKRRDNAPILKYTYQGVMNKIMKELSIEKAIEFVKQACADLLDGKFDLNMFIISKTLRDYYKDPESIAHKVLADRMGERDPGNKPSSNERIPYAYIQVKEKKGVDLLQGDKIEHVNYIKEKNLKIDNYAYINNQMLKPICQVFELVVEGLEGYPYYRGYFDDLYQQYYEKYDYDIKKTDKKISDLKQKVVEKLLFEPYLVKAKNAQNGLQQLDSWCSVETVKDTKKKEKINLEEKKNKGQLIKRKKCTLDKFFNKIE